MDTLPVKPMPKKSCMITLMFAINKNEDAIDIKEKIDPIIENIKEKRYTFQINES